VNVGTSSIADHSGQSERCVEDEVKKARIAGELGADTITDLSMAGNLDEVRRRIHEAANLPLTTIPIYQAVAENGIGSLEVDHILEVAKRQLHEACSLVLHAGFTREMLAALKGRTMPMVCKGGSMTLAHMIQGGGENHFYEHFDEFLGLLRKEDAVLVLGNTLRSGCLVDWSSPSAKAKRSPEALELELNRGLAARATLQGFRWWWRGWVGTCITAAEHLALPTVEEVREGIVSARIAAHVGDLMKYGLSEEERMMAVERSRRSWEAQFSPALDGGTAARRRHSPTQTECTMCGRFCALQIVERYLGAGHGQREDAH